MLRGYSLTPIQGHSKTFSLKFSAISWRNSTRPLMFLVPYRKKHVNLCFWCFWYGRILVYIFCLITICLSLSRSKRECLSCSKLIKYNLWILKEHNNFSYLWKFSFGEIYLEKPKNLQKFAQIKRIQVSGMLEKSRIQENLVCGIRKIAQEFRNPSHDWTPESKFHSQRLESSTWNPESTTVLDPIAWAH